MKIIIDTNILISGFVFGGKPGILIDIVFKSNKIKNHFSSSLLEEIKVKFYGGRVEAISKKGKVNFDPQLAVLFIEKYVELSTINHNPKTKITLCRDPKDNIILELTGEIGANYIITGDKDLLVLNPFTVGNHESQIVTVSQFLEIIGE